MDWRSSRLQPLEDNKSEDVGKNDVDTLPGTSKSAVRTGAMTRSNTVVCNKGKEAIVTKTSFLFVIVSNTTIREFEKYVDLCRRSKVDDRKICRDH